MKQEHSETIEKRVWIVASYDLVGFTKFKTEMAQSEHGALGWELVLRNFYRSVGGACLDALLVAIKEEYSNQQSLADTEYSTTEDSIRNRVKLWKLIGDEVLVAFKAESAFEAALACIAFCGVSWTLSADAPEGWRKPKIKGACWAIPCGADNTELVQESHGGLDGDFDLIGPAVDAGFRIASEAHAGEFLLSAELVDLIVNEQPDILGSSSPLEHRGKSRWNAVLELLLCRGRTPLKGVLGGMPYPLFYFPCFSQTPWMKRETARHLVTMDEMKELVKETLNEANGTWLEPLRSNGTQWLQTKRYKEASILRTKKEEEFKRELKRANMNSIRDIGARP